MGRSRDLSTLAGAGAIGTTSLADNAVTTAKIAAGAVVTADIADANVTGAKLENSGVTAGVYGSASAVPVVTVDAKGRVTSATTQAIASSAPTTAQVLSATAGATAGAVGTYAFAGDTENTTGVSAGGTRAGSNLRYAGLGTNTTWANGNSTFFTSIGGGATGLSGTWRAMGSSLIVAAGCSSGYPVTLWLRIS